MWDVIKNLNQSSGVALFYATVGTLLAGYLEAHLFYFDVFYPMVFLDKVLFSFVITVPFFMLYLIVTIPFFAFDINIENTFPLSLIVSGVLSFATSYIAILVVYFCCEHNLRIAIIIQLCIAVILASTILIVTQIEKKRRLQLDSEKNDTK